MLPVSRHGWEARHEESAARQHYTECRGCFKLRRMVSGLYIQNNDDRQGFRWLKSIAQLNDPKNEQWIKRDMAWHISRASLLPLRDLTRPIRNEADQAFGATMEGWQLAPDTEEGMACIKVSQRLLTYNPNDKGLNKEFETTLKSLLQGPYKEDAYRILLECYELLGDKRAIENLKAGKA